MKKGGNSHIGLATAKVLAQASQEFHLILACRSLETLEKGMQALDGLRQKGITGNTGYRSKQQRATYRRNGHLDVLMNNAGVASRHPDIKTRLHHWQPAHVSVLTCRSLETLEKGTQALDELRQARGDNRKRINCATGRDRRDIDPSSSEQRTGEIGHLDVLMNNAGVASRHPDTKLLDR
ncbi:hypothetical protein PENPOL_c002G03380 [Penicillium polonicum]|uniref:Uncharacterized protein n=1 Tax=Penicillium polonicum TaxID=60169 RepID=A0A1V6NYL0_PENPO|nr:hypothetical protein PENPOL_c002G03380 [Penicillium polonicum]